MLTRLGVPCERLDAARLADPAVAGRYGLICISLGGYSGRGPLRTLQQHVAQGGALLIEDTSGAGLLRFDTSPGRLFAFCPHPVTLKHGVLRTDHSPIFRGYEDREFRLARDVTCEGMPPEPLGPDTEAFGDLSGMQVHSRGEGEEAVYWFTKWTGGALMFRKRLGKGVAYRLAVPLSFNSMWRGEALDGILRNAILDLLEGRYEPPYVRMPLSNRDSPGALLFADDFMREKGVGGAWEAEKGAFEVTGPKPADPADAFSLRGHGPGSIAARANPAWEGYRVSASILPGAARGGVWVKLSGGGRMSLVLEGKDSKLRLMRDGSALAECSTTARAGWRRLSLCRRDGQWQGWLDGAALISHKDKDAARGGFGLVVEAGSALFDDVVVRPVSELLADSDRAPGEEGSSRALSMLGRESIEVRNIYDVGWHVAGSPSGGRALRLRLPNYVPGALLVDGTASVPIPPSPDCATVALPGGQLPQREVAFLCRGWRDYVFGDRVTDWYSSGTGWEVMPRWSCDPRWKWLGVETKGTSALWHKRPLTPPYCISALMAARSGPERDENGRTRDLNLVVGGNGKDLADGYCLRVRGAGEQGCEIWQGGKLLASARDTGMPLARAAAHHFWSEIRAIVEPGRVRMFFEGHPVLEHKTSSPVARGYVGLWTENNAVSVARVTLSVSEK